MFSTAFIRGSLSTCTVFVVYFLVTRGFVPEFWVRQVAHGPLKTEDTQMESPNLKIHTDTIGTPQIHEQWDGLSIEAVRCSHNNSKIDCAPGNKTDLRALLLDFEYSYIQIGAHTGVSNSDPLGFLRDDAKGVLVEPISSNFMLLKENFKSQISAGNIIVHNAAVCPSKGVMQMYSIQAPETIASRLPDYATQLSSLDMSHLLKARERIKQKSGIDIEPFIKATDITCETVGSLFQVHEPILNSLRLVVIDAEGHDAKIVRNFIEADICPSIMVYEAAHLFTTEKQDLMEVLKLRGYTLSAFSKMDIMAVRCS